MSYQLKTTNKKPVIKKRLAFFLLGVFLTSIIFFGDTVQKIFGAPVNYFFSPIFSFGQNVKQKIALSLFIFKPDTEIIRQNEELKSIVERQKLEIDALKKGLISAENFVLSENGGMYARVLRSPDASPYDTLLVDLGKKDGVSVGDRVFANNIIPIGELQYVYGSTSLVKLYSTPGESHVVSVGESGARSFATGRGGGNFEISFPHGVDVSVGDEVVFPELSALPFAKVSDVSETEGGTFIRVLFKIPTNLFTLNSVLIKKI